ncbi:MFS transporter [Nitrospirillum sp. BR 11164]|uniref:MFS transporter n=1 Tax=Nitrospirillum sp. BR 11164 TaxID=3104324 RepID=UPI002AFE660B|nr:MFS transporter [Nitrospirillum sp. BR 11164]MEA1648531.1 MFS transporter [Nitrospirillum sp. BR 11164]
MTDKVPAPGASIVKVAVTAAAAAAIEWYDFFIYGTAAALVFPAQFFPADLPPLVAQIAAFSTFAVGFIVRPLGGAVFGHLGDVFGRKRALSGALLLMGLATTGVGLLPGYAHAGVAAPLALVALRFAQGLAVGGQWGGAALMAIESAPSGRRGFYGSFVQIGVPVGLVLANVVFLLVGKGLTPQAFQAWGWRLPFLLSVVLVLIGGYVRRHLEEPREFETAGAGAVQGPPLARVLRDHLGDVLLAGGAFVANNTCFYMAITYVVAYGTATLGIAKETLLAAVMLASAFMLPVLIACGGVSDKFGRRGIFMIGAVLAGLWSFALFPLIETASPVLITLAIAVEMLFLSLMYGPQAALFAELFPVEVRYSGASLGYQVGSVVGGGFAPIIATALFARFQSTMPISVYLAVMCAVSFLSVLALSRRARARGSRATAG